MAYKNKGYQRATTLTIKVYNDGELQSTNVLPLMSAFTQNGVPFATVDATQIAQMSTADYNTRVAAYAAYVQANYQSQYPGLTVSSTSSRVYNTTACPLP